MIVQRIYGIAAATVMAFSLAGADLSGLFNYTPSTADSIVVVEADKLPASFTENENVKQLGAEYGFDLKDIEGMVTPICTGENDYFGILVRVKGNPQLGQIFAKAGVNYTSVQIQGKSAYKLAGESQECYIIELAPEVLLIVEDEADAEPFFKQADPEHGKKLAALIPDPQALVWAVIEVPAPSAEEAADPENSDMGVRRVTAFCRLDQVEDKIDTTIKAIFACKDAESANGCAMMTQMMVLPMVAASFSDNQTLAAEVTQAIKSQVTGNVFEVTVSIPSALADKLSEYGKTRAGAMITPAGDGAAAPAEAAPATGNTP